jgi:hypothetical protein
MNKNNPFAYLFEEGALRYYLYDYSEGKIEYHLVPY